jgi:hypothetical protein
MPPPEKRQTDMLTTLEIPDHILKHVKRRAVEEGRSLKDIVTQTLSVELAASAPARAAKWKVPVAPHDMGWKGLNWEEIQQVVASDMDGALLHRAGLKSPTKRHAQR